MPGALDRRLIVVAGKGGVGKSTLATAAALCGARRGKRVLVCELRTKERVSALLGAPPVGPRIGRIDENIEAVNIDVHESMREYGLMVLKFRAIYDAVFENRLVRYFLNAIPSLAELVMLGKVLYHVDERLADGRHRYDLVILDAPATGHAVTLLRLPQVIVTTVPPGAMQKEARRMMDILTDSAVSTALLVTLGEEMPVNEAIDLDRALRDTVQMHRSAVVVNRYIEPRFSALEREAFARPDLRDNPIARAALEHSARADLCGRYLHKLDVEIELPLIRVPDMPAESFGRPQVEAASRVLDPQI
jgi:anion-transporting  ArsA/GET3 family ATPase